MNRGSAASLIAGMLIVGALSLLLRSTPSPAPRPGPPGRAPTAATTSSPQNIPDWPDNRRSAPRALSLTPNEPVARVINTPTGPRWASIMQLDDHELPGSPEPSDLDDDHPGAYWASAGFATLREVLIAHGVDADSAWCDPTSGEITAYERLPTGGRRFISLSPDPVPGDLNADDAADLEDLNLFLDAMGKGSPIADVNDDGRITSEDAALYLRSWVTAR